MLLLEELGPTSKHGRFGGGSRSGAQAEMVRDGLGGEVHGDAKKGEQMLKWGKGWTWSTMPKWAISCFNQRPLAYFPCPLQAGFPGFQTIRCASAMC